jgi:sigma 54 modulation/S30EA-like ribosomal protein
MGVRWCHPRAAGAKSNLLTVLALSTTSFDRKMEVEMQTPVRIEFQGMDSSDLLRDEIAGHASRLEDRFGRVTSYRIVLKGPGEHHREGGLYEVNIRLSLPNGKEVNVDRTPGADERHADVHFAIGDAFKRARRRLQGHVKEHVPQPVGTVARLDDGFGFLQTSDGRRSTSTETACSTAALRGCGSFAEQAGEKGPQASTVKLLGKHGMRQRLEEAACRAAAECTVSSKPRSSST